MRRKVLRLSIVFGMMLILIMCTCTAVASVWDRESAFTSPTDWHVGLFNPLRYQVNETWSLQGHPMVAIAHPSIEVHQRLAETNQWRLNAHYGLSLPSQSLRNEVPIGLRGYLTPSCLVEAAESERNTGCREAGWSIAPAFGVRYSHRGFFTYTIDADVTYGLMLNGERPTPLDTYAPLEIVYAPLTHRHRSHLGVRAHHQWSGGAAYAFEFDVYRLGQVDDRSPWVYTAYTGIDFALGKTTSMTLGLIYWNSDQRAMKLEKDADGFVSKRLVRSHDFYPTFDVLWSF